MSAGAPRGGESPLGVPAIRPAVLSIDLHRGHLDPQVATMPVPAGTAAQVTVNNARFFAECRQRDVPVIHLITRYRDAEEIAQNPFWRSRADRPDGTRKNVLRHNLDGSPGCTVMPELLEPDRDLVVDTKKRYDCFRATDLDLLLRSHGINTVLLTGVNTNSCVLATATAACCRDYAVVVIEDCVATMDGPQLHQAGLACVRAAFGTVTDSAGVWALLGREKAAA